MNGNIYITGFMGAGKSTVGRGLAKALGRRFVELDDLIERRLGISIPQVFAQMGEEGFRSAETAELKRVAKKQRLVVATGGGLPMREENRRLMRQSGRILNLKASLKTCRGRLGEQARPDRPNWQDPKDLARLYALRHEAYGDCDLRVSVDGRNPEEVLQAAGALLFPDERHTVGLGGAVHPLVITWQGPKHLGPYIQGHRTVLLTDKNVGGLHLARYREELNEPLVLTVNPGERSKSMNTARRLYQALLDARLERGDILVALGGGMITDLGAFVASTYKRGMKLAWSPPLCWAAWTRPWAARAGSIWGRPKTWWLFQRAPGGDIRPGGPGHPAAPADRRGAGGGLQNRPGQVAGIGGFDRGRPEDLSGR